MGTSVTLWGSTDPASHQTLGVLMGNWIADGAALDRVDGRHAAEDRLSKTGG
jgi:hypothetical protein